MGILLNKSQTKVNLMRAFAGESQARNRYVFAADKAKAEGFAVLEKVFHYTADQEREHGEIFYDYLQKEISGETVTIDAGYPVDDGASVLSLLKASTGNEFAEFDHIYPAFAAIAESEGFLEIAERFRMIANIEETHGKRFALFAELLEKDRLFRADEETAWVCLNCGNVHFGAEAPLVCPVCNHNQGWYIKQELAPYTR